MNGLNGTSVGGLWLPPTLLHVPPQELLFLDPNNLSG
jgi:hypothetical protein